MIERRELPVETLTVDVVQSRDEAWVGDEHDQQLAASIATDGLLQDIIVRPLDTVSIPTDGASPTTRQRFPGGNKTDAEYAIVAGSRRYHAAMEAGYEAVPCKIVEADDLEAAWASLVENTDRRELSEHEIAQQLSLIYEFVRPREHPTDCPDCGQAVDGEAALLAHCDDSSCELPGDPVEGPPDSGPTDASDQVAGRFLTDQQALEYVAQRYYGRHDENAVSLVEGHLRTAELPPILQSLFKSPDDRTAQEQTALENYGIDTRTTLGDGGGKSGTSREIVALHETIESELDGDTVDPTDAVLETVGTLRFDEMSEQELRRTLREFRTDVTAELDGEVSAQRQRETFSDTLQSHAEDLQKTYEEVEPVRPFKKVDVLGPETQRHSRWHVQAMQRRDESRHGEMVRQLYLERLETLAEKEGWN
jgi:hypothetical protein